MQLDYATKSNNQVMKNRLKKIREVICSNIFPEINDFKFESTNTNNCVLFKTKDGWFKYTELGFGYQSTLSWVVDLCKRMFEAFPNSENPLLESAVVLVDEIDMHLHPKWQREIISYVSEIFKNVQFIVTTHSPLIIQSMQEVNLYTLRREDEKIIVEHSPVTNFSGWTVEEILRDTMKLDNDIHSDYLQNAYKMFDDGLDNNDVKKAREAYNTLIKILHPNNPARRLLKLQLSQMEIDDKD
jgi:predicted ATP-binding protein involved in virulence